MQVCVEAGGTITGEHGVGLDKRDYMGLVHGAEELAAMAAVQRAFDPDGIWNPGKVLPLTPGSGVATEVEGGRTGGDSPIQHDPEDLTVRVAGEVVMGELAGRLARAGQWLPLDVPGQAELTVAELVASGEWGPLAPALGRLRDLVLGATVETAGRGRLRLGGRVMKNVAGFDLVRAVPGSHGRFGSIEEVVFRLLPLPETHRVLALEGASHGDPGGIRLVELADRLATHPVLPASLVRVIDGEGRSSIFVRLLGSRSGVEAECDELLALLPGATVWEGEVDTPGFVARDPLGSSLAWTREEDSLLELRGGPMPTEEVEARLAAIGLPARWSYHLPGWNVWRLALPPGALEAARHEMTDLAVGLREGGGDLNLLRGQGPDLGRHAPPGIPELEEAVRHAVAGTVGPIRVGGSAR
jgi:FAD/FMN-containing dehydrogenase